MEQCILLDMGLSPFLFGYVCADTFPVASFIGRSFVINVSEAEERASFVLYKALAIK